MEPHRSEAEAWGSLGKKLIQEIMLKTGCNVACSQYSELHCVAGGATLMAHCARYKECVAIDSNELAVAYTSAGYDDVLPFSRARELNSPSAGRMEDLAKVLVSLARGDEPSMDASIMRYSGTDNCMFRGGSLVQHCCARMLLRSPCAADTVLLGQDASVPLKIK